MCYTYTRKSGISRYLCGMNTFYEISTASLFRDEDFETISETEDVSEVPETNLILNECYLDSSDNHKRKMRIINKHLLPSDTPVEGRFQLPVVNPYIGDIPDVFIPYNEKVNFQSLYQGVYCHIDDFRFISIWNRPIEALSKVKRYMVAVAPDFTLWVDGNVCDNIEQLRHSRIIQRFWQNNGVATIQNASWGNAESCDTYAFDGLADNSWTAIGHQRIGNRCEQRLFRYAIKKLIERKHPKGLLVFGAPLDFNPGVPVITKPSFITKLRKL